MAETLIAVDMGALDQLVREVAKLRDEVRAARIQPEPEWLTVREYAAYTGKTVSAVNRHAAAGKLIVKTEGCTSMVRVSRGAAPDPRPIHRSKP